MTHNNITGDKIATKAPTKAYRDGWDAIFKPELCLRCGRTGHTPEDCKMPVPSEEGRQDDHSR